MQLQTTSASPQSPPVDHQSGIEAMVLAILQQTYNANARALAYVQIPFQWQPAGGIIEGPPHILALPVLPYASSR